MRVVMKGRWNGVDVPEVLGFGELIAIHTDSNVRGGPPAAPASAITSREWGKVRHNNNSQHDPKPVYMYGCLSGN